MEGRLGSENPKYKALATQIEAMRKAYQKNLVAARQQYVLDVAEARREAASAKSSLDEATAQVAAARRELIDHRWPLSDRWSRRKGRELPRKLPSLSICLR